MRGHVHSLRLIGQRLVSGADAGRPVRDAEGRWQESPNPDTEAVTTVELTGKIGHVKRDEVPVGEDITTAAHLPRGTVVARGDELQAYDIPAPDAELNGRYEIHAVQPGRACVRVLLKRFVT